eukprot:m.118681 g.118681  ORF g.118681 m.118681 type:complete len:592 (-) comp15455_c0_seq2:2112-3887(-)
MEREDADLIREAALALIREFLSSHGLKKTVRALDTEQPRTDASITRRSDIARTLNINEWIKRNKNSSSPLPSMLEVVVQNVMQTMQNSSSDDTPLPRKSQSSTSTVAKEDVYSSISVTESLGLNKLTLDRPLKSRVTSRFSTQPQPFEETTLRPATRRTTQSATNDDSSDEDQQAKPRQRQPSNPLSKSGKTSSSVVMMMMEDMDDDHDIPTESWSATKPSIIGEPRKLSGSSSLPMETSPGGRMITAEEAVKLKRVVFGSSRAGFNEAWLKQNFVFNSTVPGLEYGLVQHEGGPCGVLAVVQAFILKELMFGADMAGLRPTPEQQETALINAITTILLGIQSSGETILALIGPKKAQHIKPTFKCDNITEKLTLISCASEFDLRRAVKANLSQFTAEGAPGVILLLYSAVLTRGLSSIREDMDEEGSKLIGSHCYCTQDLVNLLLVGYACSNTHDGDKRLGSGADVLVLKGIRKRSDIGLLSLFEHYGSIEVGVNFKSPIVPIWIIYAESHFTVLFSSSKTLAYMTPSSPFDIHYYDQLAGLDQPYTITIDPAANVPRPDDKEVLPPLEHCVRTKWKGAGVDWGKCEPLY